MNHCYEKCPSLKIHFILIFIQIAFSTVNVFGEAALESLQPFPFNCIRYLLSTPVALILAVIFEQDSLRESFKNFSKTLKTMGFLGFIMACCVNLYFYGLYFSNPINCGTLYLATVPVTAIIGMTLKLEERMLLKVVGVCFSFAGALVMVELDEFSITSTTVLGDFLVIGMVIFYSIYLVFTRKLSSGLGPFTLSFWMFLFAGLISLLPIIFLYPFNLLPITNRRYFTLFDWVSIFIVSLVGTTITYLLNNWALTVTSSLVVAIYSPLELVATILFGMVVLQLEFKWEQALGGVLIVMGLLIVLYAKRIEQKKKQFQMIEHDDDLEDELKDSKPEKLIYSSQEK